MFYIRKRKLIYLIVRIIYYYTIVFCNCKLVCQYWKKLFSSIWGRWLPLSALKSKRKILFEDIICNDIVMSLNNFCEKALKKDTKSNPTSQFHKCLKPEDFPNSKTHVINRYTFDYIQWNDKPDLDIWSLAGIKFIFAFL